MQNTGDIGQRFAIDVLAGTGGMGAVYKAWDKQGGTPVALKILHGHSSTGCERFAREARLLSELNHPGIVRYIAHGVTDQGEPYLAMEWLDGESLAERLNRVLLTVPEALELAQNVAEILDSAHRRGVVHRDIKPANIFLVDGAVQRTKLLDFGIAHVLEPAQELTATGAMLGTPGFMAPEQLRRASDVDGRTDLYALGAVLYVALCGRKMFEGDTPLAILLQVLTEPAPVLTELKSDVPASVTRLVGRLLAKEPEDRFPNAQAVIGAVEVLRQGGELDEPVGHGSIPSGNCLVLVRNAMAPASEPANGKPNQAASPQRFTPEQLEFLRSAAALLGANANFLPDGTVMLTNTANVSLQQSAATLAHLALTLHRSNSHLQLALLAEKGVPGQRSHALMRALNLIEKSQSSEVRLNDVAAQLLWDEFEIRNEPRGYLLISPRQGATSPPDTNPSFEPHTGTPVVASVQNVGIAATHSTKTKRRHVWWVGLGAVLLAGTSIGAWALYRSAKPSASPDEWTGACPFERCEPLKIPNRAEFTDALPAVKKFAASVDASAQLVSIASSPFIDGVVQAKGGMVGFVFRYGPTTGAKVNAFTIIFGHDHLSLNRNPPIWEAPPVEDPKCSARQVWRAAVAAGLEKGVYVKLYYHPDATYIHNGPDIVRPGRWTIENAKTKRAYAVKGDTCAAQLYRAEKK